MTNKIVVKNPVVELDGDEMTRIIWKKIREEVRLHIHIYCSDVRIAQRCRLSVAHPSVPPTRHQVLRSRARIPRQGSSSSLHFASRARVGIPNSAPLACFLTRPMTKSPSMLPKPSNNTKSVSNARQSHRTRLVWKSSSSKRCGRVQTGLYVSQSFLMSSQWH